MGSLFPSATLQTSWMLIAIAQCQGRMVAACFCILLLAGGSSARSQLEELQSCEKKELVVYGHGKRVPPGQTQVTSASPSGNDTVEFGTIVVFDNVLREGLANDSKQLGRSRGIVAVGKDRSVFTAGTFELTIPGCTGSLTGQGPQRLVAAGTMPSNAERDELAITGGTGAYRWALGYLEVLTVSTDPADFVTKNTVHLKYFF